MDKQLIREWTITDSIEADQDDTFEFLGKWFGLKAGEELHAVIKISKYSERKEEVREGMAVQGRDAMQEMQRGQEY